MKKVQRWITRGVQKVSGMKVDLISSHGMRWDTDGRCFETINGSSERRRPDCDWGTPNGDLIVDPWIQDALKEMD